jgi:flagellar biosynthesis protein FliR
LMGLVPAELGIGLIIGFTVRITYAAAEILGVSFAQSTGLTMGAVYDPNLGSEDPVVARIMTLFAMLLFLALGSHRVAIGYALESFRALPIGQGADIGAVAPTFVTYLSQAMDAGVRLSLPVMAVALAIQVTLALVARASPSLQIFSIGMGVTVAAGLLAILGSLNDISAGLGADLQKQAPRIEQVLSESANAANANKR